MENNSEVEFWDEDENPEEFWKEVKMVDYIFCSCGKVIDEYEAKCYWCGKSEKQNLLEKKTAKENDTQNSMQNRNT